MSYFGVLKRQFQKECIIFIRDPKQIIFSCMFFIMIVIFFPLTISAEAKTLRAMAPGIIWISLLLAIFLSSDSLFQQDYEEGIMEQWVLSGFPLTLFIFPKIVAHWCILLIPLIVICPIMGGFLYLQAYELVILVLSIICGTPAILFICALASVYCTGSKKQKGVLMALILLPLVIPVMILGSTILSLAIQDEAYFSYLCLLTACSLVAAGLIPFSIGLFIDFCLS